MTVPGKAGGRTSPVNPIAARRATHVRLRSSLDRARGPVVRQFSQTARAWDQCAGRAMNNTAAQKLAIRRTARAGTGSS